MAGPNANLTDGQELVTVPVGNDFPWYSFFISLSGNQYILRFRYNVRMQRWIMDVADSTDNDVLTSLPLLIARNPTARFSALQPAVPVGTFYVTDDTNQGVEATRYSFGIDHTLYYLDPLAVT